MILKLFSAARGIVTGAAVLMLAGTVTADAATDTKAKAGMNNWIKQCTKNKKGKTVCLTATNLFISKPRRQRLAGIAVRTEEGQPVKAMLVVLPLGTFLTSGYTLKIDKGEPKKGVFTACRVDGCHSQLQLTDEFFEEIRKGKNLHLVYINAKRQKLNVAIPLAGFSTAIDGPAAKLPPPPTKK